MFSLKSPTVSVPVGFFLILFQIQIQIQSSQALRFYDDVNYGGDSFKAPSGWDYPDENNDESFFCHNIPIYFNDRASSVNGGEADCFILYESYDCQGRSLTLPGSGSLDLGLQNFNDITSSYRGCIHVKTRDSGLKPDS